MFETLFHIAVIALAVAMAAVGYWFLADKLKAYRSSGHVEAALPGVLGVRYLGVSVILVGLLAMADYKALVLVFVVGLFFALSDLALTVKAGGSAMTHSVASVLCIVLGSMSLYLNNSAAGA